jgi:hypothetical protein
MLFRLPSRAALHRLQTLSSQIRTFSTMKEAIVSSGPKVEIVDSPIPRAEPGQVVTKIAFAANNPKDW